MFKLGIYRGPAARRVGFVGNANIVTHTHRILSEVAHPPLALVFTLSSSPLADLPVVDAFSRYRYDQQTDVTIQFVVVEGHTPYPGDYRTAERVAADAAADMNPQ